MALGPALPAMIVDATVSPQTTPPQPPTFQVGIEVINLNLSVTDGRNRYVTDLNEKNFAVFEDGVRQELSLFTHENRPISLALLIDVSDSMAEKLPAARAAAIRFIKPLRPQDSAQLVQFNDRATVLQDFTSETALLEKAINSTAAAGPTALHNTIYIALKDLGRQKKAGELRRRAVVLLTDGEDTASLVSDEQVLELARKTEINIYCISLRPNRPQDRARLPFSPAAVLLTALSRETGGQVHFPNSPSERDTVYARNSPTRITPYTLDSRPSNPLK